MIKNIKIQNIVDIIEVLKSMKLQIYTHLENFTKIFIYMFFMIFQNSMGLQKSRCAVPNDTTQEYFCSFLTTFHTSFTQSNFPMSTNMRSKQCAAQGLYTMCGYSTTIILPIKSQLFALLITTCTTFVSTTSIMAYQM
jgi:hypothetical protein